MAGVIKMQSSFKEVNEKSFEDIIAKGLSLVEFWLPLSHPCLLQDPILEAVYRELGDKLRIIRINAEDIPGLARQYDVKAIPTLLLFKNGKETKRFIGSQSKVTLLDEVNKLLVS
jgi:thioredoxin 1